MFGRTFAEDGAATLTAFGAHVDDMVGLADDVEVMFDDDDGIATVYERVEHLHQDADVLEVEARGRLVEDVDGLARIAFREFGGQFHALALAAGKRGGGLAEFDVAKANILYGLDFAQDVGHVFEELHSLVDGHVEHIGDGLAFVAYLQRLAVVALAVAFLAGHLYVGQEVHLDGLVAVAASGLTAPALHVK